MPSVLLAALVLMAAPVEIGGHAPVLPGRAGVPPASLSAAQLRDLQPVLDLLITVRLLAEAKAPPQNAPAVRAALSPLTQAATLTPAQAAQTLAQLQAALSESERLVLTAGRGTLERRADARLAQGRFAMLGDRAPNLSLNRLGFMVPGGPALIARLAAQPGLNPYLAAPNAELLTRLLTR